MCSKSVENSVGNLKNKIENALNNVEEIKTKHAEIIFRTQKYDQKELVNEEEDDIVLHVSIKIKKNLEPENSTTLLDRVCRTSACTDMVKYRSSN